MKCPYCNAENDDNAIHCSDCGELLNEETNATPQELSKEEQIAQIEQRRSLKRKRKKQKKAAVISILVIAIIAAIGYGAYKTNNLPFIDRTTADVVTVPSADKTKEPATPTELPTVEPTELPSATPEATAVPTENIQAEPVPTEAPATKPPVQAKATAKPVEPKKQKATAKPTAKPASKPVNKSTPKPTFVPVTPTVQQGSAMTSQLVKIGSASGDNGELVTFSIGNETYYAEGNSSLSGGAYYTVTAAPNGQIYNGKPVYVIKQFSAYNSNDYLIPDSSTKILTAEDVGALSKSQLDLAKNEIYARHGRRFTRTDLREYFESKSWYKVNNNYNYANESLNLNKIEQANVRFLKHYGE